VKSTVAVVAIVTCCNDVNVIDRTIESIRNQEFPRERLYIVAVDFGSTDGTYEKLLSYDRYHLGVYQVKEKIRPEQYQAKGALYASRVATNDVKYYFLLRAGDTVAPEIAAYCSTLMEEHKAISPVMTICEADVENEDGSISKALPLFNRAFVIDGMKSPMEYVSRGYSHRVFCFGYLPSMDITYRGFVPNDRTRWNNLFYPNYRRNSLYIPKTMATLLERPADDAVFNLASTYAMLLFYIRHTQNLYEDALGETAYRKAIENFAHYALYNACLESNKGNKKQAEDCLLLSTVIDPDVITDKLYTDTVAYISGNAPVPERETDLTLPPPAGSEIIDI